MIVFSEKKDLIMAIKKLKKLNSSKKFINNGSKFNHCSGTTNLIKLFFIIQHAKELLQVSTMGLVCLQSRDKITKHSTIAFPTDL